MSKKTMYDHIDMFEQYEGIVDGALQVSVCEWWERWSYRAHLCDSGRTSPNLPSRCHLTSRTLTRMVMLCSCVYCVIFRSTLLTPLTSLYWYTGMIINTAEDYDSLRHVMLRCTQMLNIGGARSSCRNLNTPTAMHLLYEVHNPNPNPNSNPHAHCHARVV